MKRTPPIMKPTDLISKSTMRYWASELGRAGGKAGTGKAKARTSEQARAAVMVRWGKVKKENGGIK